MSRSAEEIALDELSKKVIQLTRVIVFLHTRCDVHEARCVAHRHANEEEKKHLIAFNNKCIETQRAHLVHATHWREQTLETSERLQAEAREHGRRAAAEQRASTDKCMEMQKPRLAASASARAAAVGDVQRRSDRLRKELSDAEERVRGDARWLARHLAAEAARQRVRLDEEFEEAAATLRQNHTEETAELRIAREAATAAERVRHEQRKEALLREIHEDFATVECNQEKSSEAVLNETEMRAEAAQEELAAGRRTLDVTKSEYAMRQRELDDMSRDLQARKRRAHAVSAEIDQAHERRLQAETEIRELRRQKLLLERALGANARAAPAAAASETERAVAGLSEDVRTAQGKLETLRGETQLKRRLVDERKVAVNERERRIERLRRDLLEERRRSDELQRVLLRLEQET